MKHNWEYKRLGEICKISSARRVHQADWRDSGVPFYRAREIVKLSEQGYVDNELFISQELFDELSKSGIPKARDIMLSAVGTLGATYIVKPSDHFYYKDASVICLGDICSLLPAFLCYLFDSKIIKQQISRQAKGATVGTITITNASKFHIPVPPMETQEQIVAELDQINDLIAKNRELLLQLDALAQSIFYDTFGDPITNPKGFSKTSLKEVSSVKIGPFGSLLHKEDYISGGTPLVNPIHMQNGYVVADNDFTIDENKKETLSNYLLRRNDIVFGRRGDIGRCALITSNEDGYLCGTGSLFVRFIIPINSLFALWCFKQPTIKKYLIEKAKGATMLNINCGIIESIPLILPPLALQEEFAAKVEAIEAQKAKVEAGIAELQTLLDARMDYWFN